MKTGLTASAVVSSWTIAATLLTSSTSGYLQGVSGPFWVSLLLEMNGVWTLTFSPLPPEASVVRKRGPELLDICRLPPLLVVLGGFPIADPDAREAQATFGIILNKILNEDRRCLETCLKLFDQGNFGLRGRVAVILRSKRGDGKTVGRSGTRRGMMVYQNKTRRDF